MMSNAMQDCPEYHVAGRRCPACAWDAADAELRANDDAADDDAHDATKTPTKYCGTKDRMHRIAIRSGHGPDYAWADLAIDDVGIYGVLRATPERAASMARMFPVSYGAIIDAGAATAILRRPAAEYDRDARFDAAELRDDVVALVDAEADKAAARADAEAARAEAAAAVITVNQAVQQMVDEINAEHGREIVTVSPITPIPV